MTAAIQMVLGGSSVLALVAVFTVAGAALVAALAAWRASRTSRAAFAVLVSLPRDSALADPASRPRRAVLADERGGPEVRQPHGGPTTPPPREERQSPAVTHGAEESAGSGLRLPGDPDPFVRIEAIEDFRAKARPVEALFGALHDEFPMVRRQAVRSLRAAGGPRVTRALLDVANQDPSAEVREEAVAALAVMLREVRSEHPA